MKLFRVFPANRGGPTKSSILINRVFHYFHHPFWRTPIFGNTLHLMFDFYCLGFSNGPLPPKKNVVLLDEWTRERLQTAVHVEVSVDGPLLVATSYFFIIFGRFIRNKKVETTCFCICFVYEDFAQFWRKNLPQLFYPLPQKQWKNVKKKVHIQSYRKKTQSRLFNQNSIKLKKQLKCEFKPSREKSTSDLFQAQHQSLPEAFEQWRPGKMPHNPLNPGGTL